MKRHTALSLLIVLVMGLGLGCQAAKNSMANTAPAPGQTSPLPGASQLVLVVAEDWNTDHARLRRFERSEPNGTWHPVGGDVPVSLGRNGLAWGRGLHGERLSAAPAKAEGDGRAPAGVFSLPLAFTGPSGSSWSSPKFPVYRVTPQTVCVDTVLGRARTCRNARRRLIFPRRRYHRGSFPAPRFGRLRPCRRKGQRRPPRCTSSD
jgi:D-alanyl-D-alanine dipeptidase